MDSIPRWFPVDVQQTFTQQGVDVVLTTDVPCHLWLFYTFKEPWIHPITGKERGLTLPWYAYWCYVTWIVVEQEEPGDTIEHTFIITGLVTCNKIWYRFHGNIGGIPSPSDSPIIYKHIVIPPLPPPEDFCWSHCPVLGNQSVYGTQSMGMGFKAIATGTAKKLSVDIDKWNNPGPLIIRFFDFDGVGHQPIVPHLWEVSVPDDDVPAAPNHAVVTFPIPDTPIVEGHWYAFGLKATNVIMGNGYHLWHSVWCQDLPNTGGCQWNPNWFFVQWMDDTDFWFELSS